jgi:hypothetical protein
VKRHAEDAGRDPNGIGITVRTRLSLKEPAKAVEQLRAYAEIGVSHTVVEIFTLELERARSMMEVLAKEVRPALAG